MSVKAMSAVENSEGAAQKKLANASRDPIRLVRLLRGIEANGATEHGDLGVAEIAYDSRKVRPGTLFVAIHGEKTDGNKFVSDAMARGAIAILSEQARPEPIPPEFPWIKVPDTRKALASMAANYFGRPAEVLKLVGLTGTNGKTTTSYLVDSILRAAGCEVGLFGTIAYRLVRETRPAIHTTPESLDLQNFLADVVRAGGTHAVLEASSHALALDRLWGCPFAVAIFTNLTRDHLDYHKNFDDYFAAKRRLFEGTGAAQRETRLFPFPASNSRPRRRSEKLWFAHPSWGESMFTIFSPPLAPAWRSISPGKLSLRESLSFPPCRAASSALMRASHFWSLLITRTQMTRCAICCPRQKNSMLTGASSHCLVAAETGTAPSVR